MKTTIISVGNGGFNIATDIINAAIFNDVQFIVCDTDKKSLEQNSGQADQTYLLEPFGRGKVKSNKSFLVDNVLENTGDDIIVCAALGGKTGSKYAPLIALSAYLMGKFVCSIHTMPYSCEGEDKTKRADNARMQLSAVTNFHLLQNNDRLKDVVLLDSGDVNKPIVDTLRNILSSHSLRDIPTKNLDELIPEKYRFDGLPLVRLAGEYYDGITGEKKLEIFDTFC